MFLRWLSRAPMWGLPCLWKSALCSVFLQVQVQPQPLPCGLLLRSFTQGASGGREGGCRPTLIEVSTWRHLWGMSPDPGMSGLS